MRLDGWKLIAAHFGRERSTVIRWSTERGLPVHRIPGPGRASVYALREELDAWLEADRARAEEPEESGPLVAAPDQPAALAGEPLAGEPLSGEPLSGGLAPDSWLANQRSRRGLFLLVPGTIAIASLSAYAFNREPVRQRDVSLPADARAADLYLEARSDWAARRPASLEAAIGKLRQVVALDPGFAPGYAALADSYVLAREFGSLDDVEAYARAQAAADAALRIDPENPDALRASAFIEYWWRGDGMVAARLFRAAVAANPQSAQTRFWFGNVLIDNGDFADGIAELERARLLEPASLALQTDIAWARWSMGETERGQRELERLRDANPMLATVHDCLSVIYLASGDVVAFVAEIAAMADARAAETEQLQAQRLQAALARDPASVAAGLLADLEAELATGQRSSLPWPAFVATAARDRRAVLRLLETGLARGEKWGSAGLLRHMRESWQVDLRVLTLMDQLEPESLVQG